jgi:hypothetical protein
VGKGDGSVRAICHCERSEAIQNGRGSVRWIIEKLSSEIMVGTVSPSGVTPIRF